MPWYLHLALRQLFPTGRKFPFFTFISTVGVALGVTGSHKKYDSVDVIYEQDGRRLVAAGLQPRGATAQL